MDSVLEKNAMQYRADAALQPATIDEANRIALATVATESPTPTYDFDRGEVVPEVLLMSGLSIPRRLPLLDSHQRSSVNDVIGSVDGLRTEQDKLVGTVRFSSTAAGVFERVREGHLTDLSIGYRAMEKKFIARGKSENIDGRTFTGPVNVVTKWRLKEVSVTPIGADEQAKFRGEDFSRGGNSMDGAQGFEEKLTDRGFNNLDDALSSAVWGQVYQAATRRGVDDDSARSMASKAKSIGEGGEMILEHLANRSPSISPRFEAGDAARDKHRSAIRDGLLLRGLSNVGASDAFIKREVGERPAPGSELYQRGASLIDVARECCELDGYDLRGRSRVEIAQCALGFGPSIGIRSASYGYHTPGMFPQLLADVGNKSLLAGYMESGSTWRLCFRQGGSVSDFKNVKRIRLSEAQNLDVWAGIGKPNEIGLTDEQESYAVEAYSMGASISYKTLVNDDLDALTRIPMLLGASADRTVNQEAWRQVTSNPTLQDGVALFSTATGARKKTNVGTGAISATSLGAGRAVMRLQVGLNDPDGNASPAVLNLEPRFLAVPAELETAARQFCQSEFDPTQLTPRGVYNVNASLTPVIEPLLSATSAAQWYLFCDPRRCDTIEVTFLAGQETPQIRTETDFDTLSLKSYILQSFAAKAIDFRGCYRSTGS